MPNTQQASEWTYSEYVGERGGWVRDAGDTEQIVYEFGARVWHAYTVRKEDGESVSFAQRATKEAAQCAF